MKTQIYRGLIMKQAEFQDSIEWLPDMEWCAVNCIGKILQTVNKPRLKNGFYYSKDIMYRNQKELPIVIDDPENWLFKRSGEMEE